MAGALSGDAGGTEFHGQRVSGLHVTPLHVATVAPLREPAVVPPGFALPLHRIGPSSDQWLALIDLLPALVIATVTTVALAMSVSRRAPAAAGPLRLAIVVGSAVALALAARAVGDRARALIRRRVLLLAGATADDARRATGARSLEAIGPLESADAATLLDLSERGLDDVVVGRPLSEAEMATLSCDLRDAAVRIYAAEGASASARPAGAATSSGSAASSDDHRLVSAWRVYRRSAMRPAAGLAKRAFDLVFSSLLLMALSPLLLAIAMAVKLSSRGPVLFSQPRVGLRSTFHALKFRTMRVGAHLEHERLIETHGNQFKLRRDPRATPVGLLLRRFSLDELPQLLQVLGGTMSLIGPRPPMPEEVSRYSTNELRRLGVRPGLTGLWQVSGRSDLPFERCVALDAEYIERWSPRLELSIFARTFRAVLGGRGAY